ncbi:unnamed protein product [Bursaphelenchus xylophilus]|nr:unnamed protein product [Bursaphelenchus xylophilus]CAG9129319.1 unnamed protein product [Bursaphelenchus xylophilus]
MYAQLEERTTAPESTDPLTRISATEAATKIRTGKLSSFQLVKVYLKRIKEVNLYINAASETFDSEALEEAANVDRYLAGLDKKSEEYKSLEVKKPLLGVPVSIKHCFDVKGKRNIAGLSRRRNIPVATDDAEAVKRIREAGGIPFVYTNLPDACLWVETSNPVYGKTSSPYDTRTTSGGSSGGEGALISAEGSLLGIGSDLGGSVRIPALFNGIYGLKPVNDIPLEGHYPDPKDDSMRLLFGIGAMARYAEDMALFYSILSQSPIPRDYLTLKPTRVLLTLPTFDRLTPLTDDVRRAALTTARLISEHYRIPLEEYKLAPMEKMIEWYINEASPPGDESMTKYVYPDATTSNLLLEKLRSYLGLNKVNPGSAEFIHTFAEEKTPAKYDQLHRELHDYRQILNELLRDNVILVAPSLPKSHYFHNELLIARTDWFQTAIFNGLALPVATVPLGLDRDGYPVGAQIASARGNNYLLTRMQEMLEKKTGGWRPPRSLL